MAQLTPEDYNTRNIYFFYDYEEAFMRYDYLSKRFYIKLVNGGPEYELSHDTNLVCDIQRFGVEVSASDYNAGVPVLN